MVNDVIHHIFGNIGSVQDAIDPNNLCLRAIAAESDSFLPPPLSAISPRNRTLGSAFKIFPVEFLKGPTKIEVSPLGINRCLPGASRLALPPDFAFVFADKNPQLLPEITEAFLKQQL